MPNVVNGLDYLALLAEARELTPGQGEKTIRLAILADFATQHMVPLLHALFARLVCLP
jgi:hypothetical protein